MIEVNKNSYISLEEANEYFAGRLGADYWDTLDDTQKEKALITATKRIDTLSFIGSKQKPKQPLQFPRFYYSGLEYNGLQLADVPQQLKDAVCEEALTTLQYIENNSEEVFNGAISGDYQTLKLGDASLTTGSYEAGNKTGSNTNGGLLSPRAYRLLSGLIRVGYDINTPVFYERY